jgi:hypothetical protein
MAIRSTGNTGSGILMMRGYPLAGFDRIGIPDQLIDLPFAIEVGRRYYIGYRIGY